MFAVALTFSPTSGRATLTPEQLVLLDEVISALDLRGEPSAYWSQRRCLHLHDGPLETLETLSFKVVSTEEDGRYGFVEWYDDRWHVLLDDAATGWVEVFTGSAL